MMHYKRALRGIDVRTRPAHVVGDPSGYGQYGLVDDDGQTVLCHECGGRFVSVSSHLRQHGMTVADYRARHGLGRSTPLVAAALRARKAESSRAQVGSAQWRRFEAARDPVSASAARDMETVRRSRPQVAAERALRSAVHGRQSRIGAVYECPVCAATWCQVGGARQPVTCSEECWRAWLAVQSTADWPGNADRDRQIADAHATGATYQDLADRYGVSAERIGQIVRFQQRRPT